MYGVDHIYLIDMINDYRYVPGNINTSIPLHISRYLPIQYYMMNNFVKLAGNYKLPK